MRRKLLIAFGLLLINGVMMARVSAQPKADTSGGKKVTNSEGLIHSAYGKAYGRVATSREVNQWKQSDLTRDELVVKLVEQLKLGGRVDELRMTIERGYRKSFGREPTAEEVSYWRAEVKDKGFGFDGLIGANYAWLKTTAAESERKGMVERVHLEVFGRAPTEAELSEWRATVEKGWTNYWDMRNWNLQQMIAPSKPSLLNELHDMIKRAFSAAGLPQPGPAQLSNWAATVKSKQLTFTQVVEMLKKVSG